MTLIQALDEATGDGATLKNVGVPELAFLGYRLGKEQIVMSKKDTNRPSLIIHKIIDEEKENRELEFCYLFSVASNQGVILPRSYEHFKAVA